MSNPINDGGPAFPNKDAFGNMIPGMSLRDWFAGQVLPQFVTQHSHTIWDHPQAANARVKMAKAAYDIADAMLKAAVPCSPSLVWKPITEEPTEPCGWYAAAVNPVNADELDAAKINSWRERFGFTKVWYNKPGKSSPGTWWEPDPHGQRSRPIGHRMTHWAELPPVPLIPENGQAEAQPPQQSPTDNQ